VEAVDEVAVATVRIVAGHVEKRLRERQRGAQLVGGVGGESLLLGDVSLEPLEQAVDARGLDPRARTGLRTDPRRAHH
jgi:hypothetical protein